MIRRLRHSRTRPRDGVEDPMQDYQRPYQRPEDSHNYQDLAKNNDPQAVV